MGIQNNNITILPISGDSPSFSWQVGYSNTNISSNQLTFRATIRPIHGLESYTRVPSNYIYYEQTGILINNNTNQGQWTFPLETNASISGGPYRNYQVVIEAHDSQGNTSAGNVVGGNTNENGWVQFNQGYDIISVQNPRQTGIELGNNIPTQYTINTGIGNTGFILNSGNGYNSLNYMGTHGEINIRYTSGLFDSNLVGGYLYVWTGQFPKLETLMRTSGYNQVSKSKFDFDPKLGYVYNPTAAMSFRGSNKVYVSVSFFDDIDSDLIDNGVDISSQLYLSDNSICYNDISAGSISIGGFQSIYSVQYTGNAPATGILGTGITVLASQYHGGSTSVLYLAYPINISGFNTYSGYNSTLGGGMGGNSIIVGTSPINSLVNSFFFNVSGQTNDSFTISINGYPIKDDNTSSTDGTLFNVLNYAAATGAPPIKVGDYVNISTRDNMFPGWISQEWTAIYTLNDGTSKFITGGNFFSSVTSTGSPPTYYQNGSFFITR